MAKKRVTVWFHKDLSFNQTAWVLSCTHNYNSFPLWMLFFHQNYMYFLSECYFPSCVVGLCVASLLLYIISAQLLFWISLNTSLMSDWIAMRDWFLSGYDASLLMQGSLYFCFGREVHDWISSSADSHAPTLWVLWSLMQPYIVKNNWVT